MNETNLALGVSLPPLSLSLPHKAGESHMGIWLVLQPMRISILKVSPCCGGIDAGLYFDFRGCGGPARRERATRSAGASVHRTGGGSVRSGELRGHGGFRRG